ncbi:CBS domain-containing protein [Paenarthrobacter sp. NPDC018779]|uniref:CBS domain-containing protein n=1 Tax=Paenarthrobacter sp. NPDC018779 TaxID=3364375 RepID=UPI0037CA9122
MTGTPAFVEPQEFTVDKLESGEVGGLNDFLALVKKGTPWRISTEHLIRLNGNSRRGKIVNQDINEKLKNRGLVCKPAVDNADYYGHVFISDPRDELPEPETVASLPISAFRGDWPTLISCGPEMSAKKTQTFMISDDLSQIPVLSQDKKTLHGVVTWRSIAQYRGNLDDAKAKDVMGPRSHVASSSDDFLDLVDTIIAQEFVLYRAPDGCVDGIVTASDLAQAFNGTAGIYIQLQELESRIRILLDKSPIPQLRGYLEPRRRDMSKFRGATDMMFGEYLAALEDKNIWNATGIELDQGVCINLLKKVRDVRNGVMHFSSGPDDETDLESSNKHAVTRALRILRATPLS